MNIEVREQGEEIERARIDAQAQRGIVAEQHGIINQLRADLAAESAESERLRQSVCDWRDKYYAQQHVPDDYETILGSMQANLVAVRDQRDAARAEIAEYEAQQVSRSEVEEALHVLAMDRGSDYMAKAIDASNAENWLRTALASASEQPTGPLGDSATDIICPNCSHRISQWTARHCTREPIPPEPPDPYAGDDVEIHIDIRDVEDRCKCKDRTPNAEVDAPSGATAERR